MNKRRVCSAGILLVLGFLLPAGSLAIESEKSPVLATMQLELERSIKGLAEQGEAAPYFISYYVTDTAEVRVSASNGAIRNDDENRSRLLDVEVRVGDYTLDSSRRIRGDRFARFMDRGGPAVRLAIEDDPAALRGLLWQETDRKYKNAVEKLIKVEANKKVKVEEEDESADFTREEVATHLGGLVELDLDTADWRQRLKRYSALLNQNPEIYRSQVSLSAEAKNRFFVNSEGTVIQSGRTHWDLAIYVSTTAEDGMELYRYESFDAHGADGLPNEEKMIREIERVAQDLEALRSAPTIEPYTGPAILSGRAAGVFFHEIFGHRIEGHRQKDEDEGQTFTKKVGKEVLPTFLSVYDDPTLERIGETDLNGHYLYDDEGVKSERVTVVEQGVLKNFLMSRSPIAGFQNSNGHGRKAPGFRCVGRQGNLIVEASDAVTSEELRNLLIAECKRQEKPFGLRFEDIAGGFTMTGRGMPQAYSVIPIMVYRVFTDGRPDQLVRGVDLIGTPLVSFSKILACGDQVEVFNGTCGAESGGVPVSAASPDILTAEIEIQKKEKSSDRPPLLPVPERRAE